MKSFRFCCDIVRGVYESLFKLVLFVRSRTRGLMELLPVEIARDPGFLFLLSNLGNFAGLLVMTLLLDRLTFKWVLSYKPGDFDFNFLEPSTCLLFSFRFSFHIYIGSGACI